MVDIIFNTFDDSIFDMYNLVCLVGDSTFVGDNDNRHSQFMKIFQNLHHFYGSFAVQSSCWFICQNDLWLGD